ncbi:MAG TPA: 50S ribosomal protein L3 [Armatimonadota bacterium]|jgi:large subunit ribosomal protein L3
MAIRKMIMGRKVGMTQLFAEDGKAIPVTVLEVGPCFVVQRRTLARDGYESVQLGYMPYESRDVRRVEEMHRLHEQRRKTNDRSAVTQEPRGPHRLTLAVYGHFLKNNIPPLRFLKEFRVAVLDDFAEGQEIKADIFNAGEKVNVIGTSKGRGFAGVMKRHGFHGGNETHGSMFHRKAASGGATDAARVFPGARRPGHMGAAQVTVKGLTVVRADADRNLLVIKGAVPGPNGGVVVVTMPDRPTIERGKGRYVTFTALEKD